MGAFPIATKIEIPVDAKWNMLDAVYQRVTKESIFEYSGSYPTGDYSDIDSVDKIFHCDDATDEYHEIEDEREVRKWICCHKIAQAIDKIRFEGLASHFDVDFKASLMFSPKSSKSVTQNGKTFCKTHGELTMEIPAEAPGATDSAVIEIAGDIHVYELADAYHEYLKLSK